MKRLNITCQGTPLTVVTAPHQSAAGMVVTVEGIHAPDSVEIDGQPWRCLHAQVDDDYPGTVITVMTLQPSGTHQA